MAAISGLQWGLKQSFLRYLVGMAGGECTVTDGATTTASNEFLFSAAAPSKLDDEATRTGTLKFGGEVRFSGHHGQLSIRIAQPWLELDHGSGTLTLAAATHRVPFAKVTLSPDGWNSTSVELTAEGSAMFGGAYPAGSALDPLTLVF